MSSALAKVRGIVRMDVGEGGEGHRAKERVHAASYVPVSMRALSAASRAVVGMPSFMNEPPSWRASRN